MTYSIVARHPATGALGVAVQSHVPSAGAVVPAALPGIGAIATQSFPNLQVKPRGLAMLREGRTAEQVVAAMQEDDPQLAIRQFAVVDAAGRAACFTGSACIAAAGHHTGDGYSAQANMMRGPSVWTAMAEAFEGHRDGDFALALLAALDAAEEAGGDLRGQQSAALLIVPAEGTEADKLVDIRIDDATAPLVELRRVHVMKRAMDLHEVAETAIAAGEPERVPALLDGALALIPDWPEEWFWAGLTFMQVGIEDRGLDLVRRAVAADASWREMLRRLDPEVVPEAARAIDTIDGGTKH